MSASQLDGGARVTSRLGLVAGVAFAGVAFVGVALVGVALVGVTSCGYTASFEDCAVRCTMSTECPGALSCNAEGFCRVPGAAEHCSKVLRAFPSCADLEPACGADGNEDCCSTGSPIPRGTLFRSYDVAGDGMYPSPSFPATVSAFRLDRFEVTVGRFRTFVEAGMGTQATPPQVGAGARTLNGSPLQGGWDAAWNANLPADTDALVGALRCSAAHQSWTDTPAANEALPINCISWYDAFAFCAWDGGFLPTEAEWNYAAAGTEQRAFPWSNPPSSTDLDCTYANFRIDSPIGMHCTNGTVGGVTRVGRTSPTGDGTWGQSDLAGNVWEWTLDWFHDSYLMPCIDCANLTAPTVEPRRTNRGGAFGFVGAYLRSSLRGFEAPSPRYASIGVRCARVD